MICGIASEYNPFHNGHAFQLRKAKEQSGADSVICVMSMAFTQRGDPAFFDAYDRCRMALLGGADVVLGLPFSFSAAPAERFALGCVYILKQAGAEVLSFGVEKDSAPFLNAAASALQAESAAFRADMRHMLDRGCSWVQARGYALARQLGADEAILAQPNFALALAYMQADAKLGSSLRFAPVDRAPGGHSAELLPACLEKDAAFASAASIRLALEKAEGTAAVLPFIPASSASIVQNALRQGRFHPSHALDSVVRWSLRSSSSLPPLYDAAEGLENRLKLGENCLSREHAVQAVKSRRYPFTKVNRMLAEALLQADAGSYPPQPRYAYLLGFRREKQHLLALLKKADIPFLHRVPPNTADPQLLLDAKAYDLWCLGAGQPFGQMYRAHPVVTE